MADLFANLAHTTVSSGGTSAPSPGTTETWTVASSSLVPAVTTASGNAFYVNDPAANTELIAVTNVSGTTWTVTRGADGTPTTAHVTGFTVWCVVRAGFLSALTQGTTVPLSALGQQELATQRSAAMTPWFAALANREYARANICCLGDSITEGQHAVGPPSTGFENRWLARMRDMLRSRYPTQGFTGGGRGFIGIKGTGESSFTWPFSLGGTFATGITLGPKAQFVQFNGSGESGTVSLVADAMDIMWTQAFGGGSFSYSVDGAVLGTVSTNASPTVDGKLTRVSFASPGSHSVVLNWVSGSSDIDGVIEYLGDKNQGIAVHDCGHFGWTTANWVTALNGGTAANCGAAIAALSPGAVVITLGVNDQFAGVNPATFQANLGTIISDLKTALGTASPYPTFVLQMLPPRTGQSGYTFPWSQYVSAAYSVAAADTSGPGGTVSVVTVMDWTLGPRMPGADSDAYGFWQSGDLVHPSNLGHQMIADQLTDFMSAGQQ